jgi:hypothetical protein
MLRILGIMNCYSFNVVLTLRVQIRQLRFRAEARPV